MIWSGVNNGTVSLNRAVYGLDESGGLTSRLWNVVQVWAESTWKPSKVSGYMAAAMGRRIQRMVLPRACPTFEIHCRPSDYSRDMDGVRGNMAGDRRKIPARISRPAGQRRGTGAGGARRLLAWRSVAAPDVPFPSSASSQCRRTKTTAIEGRSGDPRQVRRSADLPCSATNALTRSMTTMMLMVIMGDLWGYGTAGSRLWTMGPWDHVTMQRCDDAINPLRKGNQVRIQRNSARVRRHLEV